jgi:hypothetical protein
MTDNNGVTFEEEDDDSAATVPKSVVLGTTDWTTETMISAIDRGTIQLTPRFQRRDAWDARRKSRFIESLVVGLPIPQIVLAESIADRSKFIVLDGKQRLLALLQFFGKGTGPNNGFRLRDLELDKSLQGLGFSDLQTNPGLQSKRDSLLDQTIRTIVIRGWSNLSFLHTVFLRLNTGSLPLSSQELRQAAFPGPYTDALDDFCIASKQLQAFLGLQGPDYRMRDSELVARFVAFSLFLEDYQGRMKPFLDSSFETLNKDWSSFSAQVTALFSTFDATLAELEATFGDKQVARKANSKHLNKALFDALAYHFQNPSVRPLGAKQRKDTKAGLAALLKETEFVASIDKATADVPRTAYRLQKVGELLHTTTGAQLPTISLRKTPKGARIKVA